MPPHPLCGDFAEPTFLQCTPSSWKKICRMLPHKRDFSCAIDSPIKQQNFSVQFQASQVSLYSVSLSSEFRAADIYLDGTQSGQLQLAPHNSSWSRHDLDPNAIHILTISPPISLPIDLLILILSNRTNTSHLLLNTDSILKEIGVHADPASEKDESSGAVISIASLGAVIMVVLLCSVCYFLSRSRRRPGFHMPSVLVNVTASDESNTDTGSNNYHEDSRKGCGYEGYELSTRLSTGTKTTWKALDDRHQLDYEHQSRSQFKPFSENPSKMPAPPSNHVFTIPSSHISGSETPKRRLSWHEDQVRTTSN